MNLTSAPAVPLGIGDFTNDQLRAMVSRFLCWPLPKTFGPDCHISFDRAKAQANHAWPVGTNLLTADEARAMLEHVLDAVKTPVPPLGIGDINSDAKGSGARYNNGKPPFELIPFTILANTFDIAHGASEAGRALETLGAFQARSSYDGDRNALIDVINILGGDDLYDAWVECSRVFDYGRKKYAEWNWAKGMPWSVPLACAARHLIAMIRGEQIDPESGLSHRGHVLCNVVMLLVYLDAYAEGDDRPAAGLLAKVEA